jgi:hypothetical protein
VQWSHDAMTKWRNDKMTKWHNDKMCNDAMTQWLNVQWRNDKMYNDVISAWKRLRLAQLGSNLNCLFT